MENLLLAHKNASKGKRYYKEVVEFKNDKENLLSSLRDSLINKTYKTSEYEIFTKNCGDKVREIYRLPYYPDRICQWAIIQVIEKYLIRTMTSDTYSAIPGRGIHKGLVKVKKSVKDLENTKYCLKIDVKKYYPSINHEKLKLCYKRIFKDNDLLWLIDEIIDSTGGDYGIPIGNYLSQYSGNLYLSKFDHYVKEILHVKHYFRYMDDIVIFSSSKEELREIFCKISIELNKLDLEIKSNYQVFPTSVRGVDFLGYRIFHDYVLVRKRICNNLKKKMNELKKKDNLSEKDISSIQAYNGWIKHANSKRLYVKYIEPLIGGNNE